MNLLLKSIPVPLSGLMLGLVALAKLFFLMKLDTIAMVFFIVGAIFFILLFAKCIFTPKDILRDLKNPIIASVAPTFTMGAMVIANIFILHNTALTFANALWVVAVVLHLILVGYFVIKFIIRSKLTLQSVFPSWFVTFVGMGMMPITAPDFAKSFTLVIFYISVVMFIVLLPFVLKRIFILRDLPIPTKPLIVILAAPASLCLTAYMVQFESLNSMVIKIVLVVAQIIYFIVIYELQSLIKMPFYPSFGAFTFPLVVCATSLYTASKHLPNVAQWFDMLVNFETIIATGVMIFVVLKYVKFIITSMVTSKNL